MVSAAECIDLARAHLPQPLADRWISLLRPAIEFPYDEGRDPQEAASQRSAGVPDAARTALRTGGEPSLPDAVRWPRAPDYGPLTFMAGMDCAAVAAAGDVDLLADERASAVLLRRAP
jgi:hypothetical protein